MSAIEDMIDEVTTEEMLDLVIAGVVATSKDGSVLSDFAYTGHHVDRPTGLNLAQYRGYDAGLGRWLNKDPKGLAGGLNLYRYVNDSPINAIDPQGATPWPTPANVRCLAQYYACLGRKARRRPPPLPDDGDVPLVFCPRDPDEPEPVTQEELDEGACAACYAECTENASFWTPAWPGSPECK